MSKTGDTLYLHVLEWPETGSLVLNGINSKVTSAIYLTTGTKAEYSQAGDTVTFALPSEPVDQYDTVIKVIVAD